MAFTFSAVMLTQLIAEADSSLSINTRYYDLDPGLSILKPTINFIKEFSLDTILTARFTLDRVTTRPVDAISSASQTMGKTVVRTDIRQEYVVSVTHSMGLWRVNSGLLFSHENDYRSISPSIGVSRDFVLRNTTLDLGYAHNFDTVYGQYMSRTQSKDVDNFSLSLTQVLSKTRLAQLGYTYQANRGYLGTGNRQLVLSNGSSYPEYLPSYRNRQALGLRLAQWFTTRTAVHLGYRYYQDDWDLTSHTWDISVHQRLPWNLKAQLAYRGYSQSRANFVRDIYNGSERYLTAANTLKTFSSRLFGFRLSYRSSQWENYQFVISYERYQQTTGLTSNIYHVSLYKIFE